MWWTIEVARDVEAARAFAQLAVQGYLTQQRRKRGLGPHIPCRYCYEPTAETTPHLLAECVGTEPIIQEWRQRYPAIQAPVRGAELWAFFSNGGGKPWHVERARATIALSSRIAGAIRGENRNDVGKEGVNFGDEARSRAANQSVINAGGTAGAAATSH